MSNVVALPGYTAPSDEPVQRVVEILEDYLSQAKEGRLIGVAIVAVERQPIANIYEFHAEHSSRHSLFAGVMGLHWRFGQLAATPDKDDDSIPESDGA